MTHTAHVTATPGQATAGKCAAHLPPDGHPCGRDATTTITTSCLHGHTNTHHVCRVHQQAALTGDMTCRPCRERGRTRRQLRAIQPTTSQETP